MALFKGGLKLKVSKEDALKSLVLMFVGCFQGGLGVLASYIVTFGTAFNMLGWSAKGNQWNVGCWQHVRNSFFVQIAWFPSSISQAGVFGPYDTVKMSGSCISMSEHGGQMVGWGGHLVLFYICAGLVVAGLTGSKKKVGLYFGGGFIPLAFMVMTTCLLVAFVINNQCMSGGLYWRWQNLSFASSSGKTKRVGKDTDSPYSDYNWLDAGWYSVRLPECWWAVMALNCWFAIGPFMLVSFAGICIYIPERKYKECAKFVAPFSVYLVAFCCYGVFMPRLYIDEDTTDDDRVIYRVVAHPAMMEAMAMPFRSVGKGLTNVSLRIAYLFFPVKTTTLYSRLLVNSVADETLLIVSSVALGFVEIFMRTTVHQRDKLQQIVSAKLTGRKFTSFDRAFLMEYKCSLVVLEMVFELADIFTMAGFFSLISQPDGALRKGLTLDSGNKIMRGAGFKIESYVINNALIQVAIETAVGLACLILEVSLGFPVLQIVRKGYFVPFFAASTTFGFLYTILFLTSLFFFPIVNLKEVVDKNRSETVITDSYYGLQNYYDLYNTW
eukprot:CAMPEP_0197851654 /NCGR_PEP_ID=MMETSP1438-20131217/18533_1 /TAXON_ID=1461541 /ORGANISM="Pterosperma sp., Strain CCMP1384" /LENGTH=552 /DNA_ID=CAMNT_0043465339 /DNA_START=75 /DNA_END=1730 /DNA_ORIENTATION=+